MACPLDIRPRATGPSMMISPYSLRNTGFHRFWLTSWLTFSRQPRRQPPVRQAGAKTKKARQPSDCQAFSSVGVTGGENRFFRFSLYPLWIRCNPTTDTCSCSLAFVYSTLVVGPTFSKGLYEAPLNKLVQNYFF